MSNEVSRDPDASAGGDVPARPRCPICGGDSFRREKGKIDSAWGLTAHKVDMLICERCGNAALDLTKRPDRDVPMIARMIKTDTNVRGRRPTRATSVRVRSRPRTSGRGMIAVAITAARRTCVVGAPVGPDPVGWRPCGQAEAPE